jgi:hypothetical protein
VMSLHSVGGERLFHPVGHDYNLRWWSTACEVTFSGESEGEDSSMQKIIFGSGESFQIIFQEFGWKLSIAT